MTTVDRREALKVIATTAAAGLAGFREDDLLAAREVAVRASEARRAGTQAYAPQFFTDEEWRTVRILVDDIIPRDERSGSATDAGVPEYIDFLLFDQTPAGDRQAPSSAQVGIRGGLRWLDGESRSRHDGKAYADCTPAQRHAILDDIAWPERAQPEFSHGVAFFTRMRDLTGSGFFSSKMGVEDLRYTGNTVVPRWTGCPEPVLRKLGIS
jgi:hypothetical protein